MHEYAPYTIRHVLFPFKRGCISDGSQRAIHISAYTVFYDNLFHLLFKRSLSLKVKRLEELLAGRL
jgi:hypothetical protein